jgi:hypothetical protein
LPLENEDYVVKIKVQEKTDNTKQGEKCSKKKKSMEVKAKKLKGNYTC